MYPKKKSSVVRGISERMIFGGCLFVGEVFLDCFACRKVQSSQKAPAAESESGKSWQAGCENIAQWKLDFV